MPTVEWYDPFSTWATTTTTTYASNTTFNMNFFNTTSTSYTTSGLVSPAQWRSQQGLPTEPLSAEAQLRLWRQTALRRQLRRSQDRREEMAQARAEALLVAHLTPEQAAELAEANAFVVVCPRSRRRFKVRRQWSGNLDELDADGRRIARYCVHHRMSTPVEDNMFTQKMWIESGGLDELLAVANRS